jgi:hypothetical protein
MLQTRPSPAQVERLFRRMILIISMTVMKTKTAKGHAILPDQSLAKNANVKKHK